MTEKFLQPTILDILLEFHVIEKIDNNNNASSEDDLNRFIEWIKETMEIQSVLKDPLYLWHEGHLGFFLHYLFDIFLRKLIQHSNDKNKCDGGGGTDQNTDLSISKEFKEIVNIIEFICSRENNFKTVLEESTLSCLLYCGLNTEEATEQQKNEEIQLSYTISIMIILSITVDITKAIVKVSNNFPDFVKQLIEDEKIMLKSFDGIPFIIQNIIKSLLIDRFIINKK